jgi:hypothetical protein
VAGWRLSRHVTRVSDQHRVEADVTPEHVLGSDAWERQLSRVRPTPRSDSESSRATDGPERRHVVQSTSPGPSHGPGPEISSRQLSRALHWNKPSQPIRVAESGHLSRLGRAIPGCKLLPLRGGVPQTVPTARRPPPPSQQTRPSGARNTNNPDGHGPGTRKLVYGMGRIISRHPGRRPYWRTSELPIGTYRYDYKLTCPPAYMNGRGEIEVAVR